MANIDDAYTVTKLSLDDEVLITHGSLDPSTGAGYESPIGSLYVRTNGSLYQKTGALNTQWGIVGGIPNVGKLIQVKFGIIPALSGTTVNDVDSSPLITDGTQVWTNTITPTSASNRIRVSASMLCIGSTSSQEIGCTVWRNSTLIGATKISISNKDKGSPLSFIFYDIPALTTPITYSCRIGRLGTNGTWYINSIPTTPSPVSYTANAYSIEEIGT